ncbi:retrotransposon protein, putative, ty1-copia subclass [Tanacetum coccineum]|uniref:Retrotransposon protein, putative, ty1-copia subclass n=1 Tax=Tanacetum coccineum TaxID=301880 RepID=A0ABQ5HK63_9ASTR
MVSELQSCEYQSVDLPFNTPSLADNDVVGMEIPVQNLNISVWSMFEKKNVLVGPAKDDACHHCKEVGHWKRNCPVYLAELQKKRKQVGSASSSVSKNGVLYFNAVPRNGIYEIDMHDLVPNVNSIYNVSNKRVKHNLDSTYLWHCRLAHINKKRIKQLANKMRLLNSTDD